MIRLIYSGLFILILGWTAGTPDAFALAEVKSSATVSKSTVTLGDLFDNLDTGHDIWVMNAPAPGKRTTISTRYLANLTRQHNVYWRNSRAVQHVTVLRAGQSVKFADLKPLIEKKLAEAYPDSRKQGVSLDNQNAAIYLPEDASLGDITISALTYSARTRSFVATASLPVEDDKTATATIRGRTYAESYVPTLNRTILPGQAIRARDIGWMSMPTLRIGRNIIRDKDQLVGMTPRRGLNTATPIKLSDLQRPQIISRGKPVTILFKSGKITLTAIGKAVENGGRGDIIRVMNAKSHKTIEAVVTGPNQVQVLTARTDIAQLAGTP